MNENKDYKNAFEIAKNKLKDVHINYDNIDFYEYKTREEFNKKYRKLLSKNPEGNWIVGFACSSSKFRRFILKKIGEVHIISKEVFKKEAEFKNYYFNVLVHEISHIFLWFSSINESFHEYLCYYIANQRRYHKNEYKKGRKIFNLLNKNSMIQKSFSRV